jgi:hypothetical protein
MNPTKQFVKEFINMAENRRAVTRNFEISTLLLPNLGGKLNPQGEYKKVVGIEEPFFELLNGEIVEVLSDKEMQKREVLPNGKFLMNEDGTESSYTVEVPTGAVIIKTTKNIKLRNHIIKDGEKYEIKIDNMRFKYIDYQDDPDNQVREYFYYIPRENLEEVNLTALIVTVGTRSKRYKGYKIVLQNGYMVNLYVIPFKKQKTDTYRVVAISENENYEFKQEIEALMQFWEANKIMFPRHLTELEEQYRGRTNIAVQDLEQTLIYQETYGDLDMDYTDNTDISDDDFDF